MPCIVFTTKQVTYDALGNEDNVTHLSHFLHLHDKYPSERDMDALETAFKRIFPDAQYMTSTVIPEEGRYSNLMVIRGS